jgi:hypothetical protein
MGRRTVLEKFLLLNNQNTASTITSDPTEVSGLDNVTYEISINALADSFCEPQFCNDRILSPSSVFKPLDFGSQLTLLGTTDTNYTITIKNQGFKHLRLNITNNGGTGNLSAWVTGNCVGA